MQVADSGAANGMAQAVVHEVVLAVEEEVVVPDFTEEDNVSKIEIGRRDSILIRAGEILTLTFDQYLVDHLSVV